MNLESARRDFEQFLSRHTGSPQLPPPASGFQAMLEFYRTVRADDSLLEQDGDMLLFQWGTYDWGEGRHDEVGLTRQLIGASGEDDEIWQLTFVYRLAPNSVLAGIAPGNTWCHSLSDLPAFQAALLGHPAYGALLTRPEARASLDYGPAG